MEQSSERPGCARGAWTIFKLPFMVLGMVPKVRMQLFESLAATDTGERARASFAVTDPAATDAVVAAVVADDPRFDVAATVVALTRVRDVVEGARRDLDPSAARAVMSDGLWQVFAMLCEQRPAHGLRREGSSRVGGAVVAAATRDRLAVELRIRLTCEGERCDRISSTGAVVRGGLVPQAWDEYWTIRRAAGAITAPQGGILDGRCPQCGAPLRVNDGGACEHCKSLVLSDGQDWTVWNIEKPSW